MGEIIHRINAPFITSVMMLLMTDTINDRVAHMQIRRGHVNLGAQRFFPLGKFTGLHPFKEFEVLLRGTTATGAFLARLLRHPAIVLPFFRLKLTNISLAVLNELHRITVQLIEIFRGKICFLGYN